MLQYGHIQCLVVDGVGRVAETALGQFHHLAVGLGIFSKGLHGSCHQEFGLLGIHLGHLFYVIVVLLGCRHGLSLDVEPSCDGHKCGKKEFFHFTYS